MLFGHDERDSAQKKYKYSCDPPIKTVRYTIPVTYHMNNNILQVSTNILI